MPARFLWILCMSPPDEIWGANDSSRFSLREMIFILWFFTSSDSNSILLLNFSTTWKTIFTLEKDISWNKTGCFIFRSNEWSVLIHRMSGAVGGEEFWEDRILHPPPPSPSLPLPGINNDRSPSMLMMTMIIMMSLTLDRLGINGWCSYYSPN